MQQVLERACQSVMLAAFAFAACWIMTTGFNDTHARLILAAAFASWVAAGSGITGFLLARIEEKFGV